MFSRWTTRGLARTGIALGASLALGACNTAGLVARPTLAQKLQGDHHTSISLPTVDGGSQRLDPRSRIRFELGDRTVTEWVRAADLRTGKQGIFVGTELLATWEELRLAEVENLSGGKVLFGVLAVAAVVAIVVAMVAGKGKGGGGGKSAKVGGAKVRGSRGGGSGIGGLFGASGRGHRRVRRRHYYRHRPHLGLRLGLALAAGSDPPPPPPPRTESFAPREGGEGERPTQVEQPPAVTRPLFTKDARRRASYRFFAAASMGSDLRNTNGLSDELTLGIRFAELLELGAGFRHSWVAHTEAGQDHAATYQGFLRLGLHIDLDSGRYIAVPISMDVGFGSAQSVTWKLNFGLRVRPVDWLWVGLYLFNPSYDKYDADTALAKASRWSFPSSLEVGFTF